MIVNLYALYISLAVVGLLVLAAALAAWLEMRR